MILTRYLYPKNNVEYSLKIAIFQENLEHALFWAYELYFSGFKQQVLQLLMHVFDVYFEPSFRKTKITQYLQKKMKEWQTRRSDAMVATFVANILRGQIDDEKIAEDFTVVGGTPLSWENYARKPASTGETQIIYITFRETDIQKYKNRPLITTKSWKIPPKVCLYSCLREPGSILLTIGDYDNWLVYASRSPVWKSRIEKYGGIVDYSEKTVTFSDENLEEAFYNLYNLEPDEQPLIVQKRWFGTAAE